MYQQLDKAEFVIRVPTPVTGTGGPETSHYSKIVIIKVQNEIFSIAEQD